MPSATILSNRADRRLDTRDLISGFDGNAAGGQDFVSLTALFDSIGVAVPDRASHVEIIDKGSIVEIRVDTSTVPGSDGSFDLFVATLQTKDTITVGADVLV